MSMPVTASQSSAASASGSVVTSRSKKACPSSSAGRQSSNRVAAHIALATGMLGISRHSRSHSPVVASLPAT
jgi:hypothetical protein